jgi:hypothetical protein
MAKQTLTFKLPKHPKRGQQQIIIERDSKDSPWLLVIDNDKAKPLIGLINPKSPKDVLDALSKTSGNNAVFEFCSQGYSVI